MAGDSDIIGQDEIEALLHQARGAAKVQPNSPGAAAPATPAAIRQAEIDSLLGGTGTRPATATVAGQPSTGDDIQFLLDQAEAAIASVNNPNPTPSGVSPFTLRDFSGSTASQEKATIDLLRDVELDLKIELGRTNMNLEDVLKLRRGSVVALDKLAGDPVDVYVNGRLIARGEVLVLNDNFCVRVAELVTGEEAA